MTDNELIKALECCFEGTFKKCEECPLKSPEDELFHCLYLKQKLTLDLINRQKAEIERLNIELQAMRGAANSYKTEAAKLEKQNKILSANADTAFQDGLNESQDLYKEQIKREVKSEAIKELAERICEGRVSNDPVVIAVKVELECMKAMTEVEK